MSYCRFGQRVTVVIGEPILLEDTVTRLESRGAGEEEKRRTITAVIQGRNNDLTRLGFIFQLNYPIQTQMGFDPVT